MGPRFDNVISFDEAFERVCSAARALGVETISVGDAANRVLADPVVARISSPRCDVSAMDGYAVRELDLTTLPARLRVIGESFAGAGWHGVLGKMQCVRVFTGASVPAQADRVIIQEHVRQDGNEAIIDDHPGKSRHIRRRGEDFQEGDELLSPGWLLDKRAIVATAAADIAQVKVCKRPSVVILSTGDELADPGSAQERPDAIPESVSLGVAALVTEWGATVVDRRRLPDDLRNMEQVAAEAIETSDLVIVTGGASVGERDFAKAMFEPTGLELIFSKVSIKPGKPVWLGRSRNALVMGLPGNPTSALVTARLLLAPLLAGLSGRDPKDALRWRTARLVSPLAECGSRETFHRGRWSGNEVELFAFQDSSAQKVLAKANVLVRQRANSPEIGVSEEVKILDF